MAKPDEHHSDDPPGKGAQQGWWRRSLPYQDETTVFILMSSLDVFMTYMLLRRGGQFYESNPIARWFIEGWGVKGMVAFKYSMVAIICVIAQVVGTKRPVVARWLLIGGTIVVSAVVLYSFLLLLRA